MSIQDGRGAQEAHHEVGGRLVVDLVGGAHLFHAALVDDHDLVGHLEGFLLVVGDKDRGDVHLVVQAPQPLAQLLAHLRVERTEGLVEQQHRGLDRERPSQRHALTLPARQLRGEPMRELLQMHQFQQFTHALVHHVLGTLADLQAKGHVLGHTHVLERRIVLEHEAHAPTLRGQARRVDALDLDGALIGLLEAGDDAQ